MAFFGLELDGRLWFSVEMYGVSVLFTDVFGHSSLFFARERCPVEFLERGCRC